jgi:hypothetical protein
MVDDPSADDVILPSLGVFRHIADQHKLFKAMLGSRGIDLVHRAAQDALIERARSAIDLQAAAGEAQHPTRRQGRIRRRIAADISQLVAGQRHALHTRRNGRHVPPDNDTSVSRGIAG